jgi:hypothetical protein
MYMDCLLKKAIGNWLHPDGFNWDEISSKPFTVPSHERNKHMGEHCQEGLSTSYVNSDGRPTWSVLRQVINNHLTSPTIFHAVWAWTDDNSMYKSSVQT